MKKTYTTYIVSYTYDTYLGGSEYFDNLDEAKDFAINKIMKNDALCDRSYSLVKMTYTKNIFGNCKNVEMTEIDSWCE